MNRFLCIPARVAGSAPVVLGMTALSILLGLSIVTPAAARDNCDRARVDGSLVYEYFDPATVNVGRDAAIGDVIGPWITARADPAWICTRDDDDADRAVDIGTDAYGPYAPPLGSLSYGGESYTVYRFGDASSALAYIGRWRTRVDGQATPWTPLNGTAGSRTVGAPLSVNRPEGSEYQLSIETQIRFVKRTDDLGPGYSSGIADPFYIRPYQNDNGSPHSIGLYRISQSRRNNVTFMGGGTCVTPDVNVALKNVNISDLSRNPRGPLADFDLRFLDCPAGLSRIQYRFSPTTATVPGVPGAITLDSSSTAGGVAVQILDGDNQPIGYNTLYTLAAYDPGQKRSYTIPMRAAIYRIDDQVTPGRVQTAVTFTLLYQ